MDLDKQIEFISEIEKLKTIKRQNKTLDGRFENSAEHSWHLAIMAIVLNNIAYKNVNKNRIIEMLLIHDLVEIYAGDAFLYDDKERLDAKQKEEKAANKLFSILSREQKGYFEYIRNEFESESTMESKIAKSLDAFQPLLNHLLTCERNVNTHGLKKSQIIQKKEFIKDYLPELWPYVIKIIDESVEKGLYYNE